jgi:hypothetical protein
LQVHKQCARNEKDTYKQLKAEQDIPYIRFWISPAIAVKQVGYNFTVNPFDRNGIQRSGQNQSENDILQYLHVYCHGVDSEIRCKQAVYERRQKLNPEYGDCSRCDYHDCRFGKKQEKEMPVFCVCGFSYCTFVTFIQECIDAVRCIVKDRYEQN